MRTIALLAVLGALLAGCTITPGPVPLPQDRRQPRLAELLVYLEYRGVEQAARAPIFEMSHWLMYDDPGWADEPRKPRFEGAEIDYKGIRTLVAVSPVKHAMEKDTFVRSEREKDGKRQVVGATLLPAGRRWSVGFTMAQPDPEREHELEQLMQGFVDRFTSRPVPATVPSTADGGR